ncbi:MAG: single-stranded DNA-binding protein, partial [Burkholderiaceae bacterium]
QMLGGVPKSMENTSQDASPPRQQRAPAPPEQRPTPARHAGAGFDDMDDDSIPF